jgi:predicted dinucleotide-binding enzyme
MRIGIVGAGMIGSTLAKLWVEAGHEVRLASRHPEDLQSIVAGLGKGATAGTPGEAAAFGEVVMLSVPLRAVSDLARDLAPALAGKVVLDTGNAYEKRDGLAAREAGRHQRGTAGWAAEMFPGADGSRRSIRSTSRLLRARRIGPRTPSASRWPAMTSKRWRSPPGWCATRASSR